MANGQLSERNEGNRVCNSRVTDSNEFPCAFQKENNETEGRSTERDSESTYEGYKARQLQESFQESDEPGCYIINLPGVPRSYPFLEEERGLSAEALSGLVAHCTLVVSLAEIYRHTREFGGRGHAARDCSRRRRRNWWLGQGKIRGNSSYLSLVMRSRRVGRLSSPVRFPV